MLQTVSFYNNTVSFLGVVIPPNRVPTELKRCIKPYYKTKVSCFLIRKESIEISSMQSITLKGIAKDVIQLSNSNFSEILTIAAHNGIGYVFLNSHDHHFNRRSSGLSTVSQSQVHAIFDYFCRVTQIEQEEEKIDVNDFTDDFDLEMMFSSKVSPIVGSFVDSFIDHFPIFV